MSIFNVVCIPHILKYSFYFVRFPVKANGAEQVIALIQDPGSQLVSISVVLVEDIRAVSQCVLTKQVSDNHDNDLNVKPEHQSYCTIINR